MQVGTERQAGSELHAWRQFRREAPSGWAFCCWAARPLLGRGQLAGHEQGPAIRRRPDPVGRLRAGRRLGRIAPADRRRRARRHPGAPALAGILLGALLALLGQTYQTGADTLGTVRLVGRAAAALGAGRGQPGGLAAMDPGRQRGHGPVAGRAGLQLVGTPGRDVPARPDRGRPEPGDAGGLGTGAPLARTWSVRACWPRWPSARW